MILENGVLKHTKGDTGGIHIKSIVIDDGSAYTLAAGDTITFTVRQKPTKDSDVLIQVETTTMDIPISPSDTANVKPGKYSADIELKTAYGDIYTIWPPKANSRFQPNLSNFENFWLWPEVT